VQGRSIAALGALLAVLFAGGFLAVGALGRGSADSPLIVFDRSIGGVAIGMTQAQVEALYGTPDSTMAVVARGGGTGLLARYQVHGGVLIVVYAAGRVVSVETDSSFYRTNTRIGPGTSSGGLHGFHQDLCSGGLWDGGAGLPPDGVVTVFQRSGDLIADVTITQVGYYDLCESEGTGQGTTDPRPRASRLTVEIDPPGGGSVQGGGLKINCPTDCSTPFDTDASVTLTAQPTAGFTFVGWSGACVGAGACVVTLDGPATVIAHFAGSSLPVTTTRTGTAPAPTTTTVQTVTRCTDRCGTS
jgi:Divergent InlB B-repeat domain